MTARHQPIDRATQAAGKLSNALAMQRRVLLRYSRAVRQVHTRCARSNEPIEVPMRNTYKKIQFINQPIRWPSHGARNGRNM